MANRHLFNAPIPGAKDLDIGARLHGDNLEEEIRDATGLRAVEVTLVGESLQVAIAGERPAGELEDLEKQIKGVIRKHRGMTEDQVQDLTKREGGRKRLKQLGAKVAGCSPRPIRCAGSDAAPSPICATLNVATIQRSGLNYMEGIYLHTGDKPP
jgi:hypothetical protein